MTTGIDLYMERLNRIKTAVALEKTDKVPVVIMNDMFAARHMGVKLSEYVKDPVLSSNTMLQSVQELGDVDGVQVVASSTEILSMIFNTKVKVPGVELGEEELWQIDEVELMSVEDYDTIINGGWGPFIQNYYMNKLDNLMARLMPFFGLMPQLNMNFVKAGYPSLNNGSSPTIPFEVFCGGRTMVKFMRDLYKYPDKVQAAMDVVLAETLERSRQMIRGAGGHVFGTWVGGWRTAPEFLSKKLWERFVWPYHYAITNMLIEEGVVPIFHLDSDWGRELEHFKEFPKGKCIICTDGSTDIYEVKEVLGDTMCICGDVSPSLLTLGTPDEVYNYSSKLIRDLGPTGFILGQGCDIPINAKVENVKAMIAAARE